MDRPSRKSPPAGGIFLAVLPLAGALIGLKLGEPSIGLLVGLGAGAGAALLIWLVWR